MIIYCNSVCMVTSRIYDFSLFAFAANLELRNEAPVLV